MLRTIIMLLLMVCGPAGAQEQASALPVSAKLTVIVVNIESLLPDEVLRAGEALPNLQYLRTLGTWYTEARGVFPADSLTGQAALMTGRYPEENGIGSTMTWSPGRSAGSRPLNRPTDLTAPTLFRLLRRHCPALATAGVFADTDTQQLLSSCGREGRHCSPYTASPRIDFDPQRHEAFDPALGRVPDQAVTAAARAYLPMSNLLFLSYSQPDTEGHNGVPEEQTGIVPGRAYRLARLDAQLGLLIEDLKRSNRWHQSVLFLTSTHGMEWSEPRHTLLITEDLPPDWQERFVVLGGGGTLSLFLKNRQDADNWLASLHLAEALRNRTGVMGAWLTSLHSELLNERAGSELAALLIPRNLRARSARIGDLLIAAQPGYRLADRPGGDRALGGFHGGVGSLRTTLLVSGGATFLRPQLVTAPGAELDENGRADPLQRLPNQGEVVDIAPTIAWLLGLADPPPEDLEAGLTSPAFSGRILHEAFQLPAVRPLGTCGKP